MLREPDLIVNADGSVYHLCLKPEDVANTVIVTGDPGRVRDISRHFSRIENTRSNREFVSCTGYSRGDRITVLSTGIGTDNIDIVMHELEALANYDLITRAHRAGHRQLTIIRIGTSGAIQPDVPLNSFGLSTHAVGLDNLLYHYRDWQKVADTGMMASFLEQTGWRTDISKPYIVPGDPGLIGLFTENTVMGMTATAPGFYGPQGRHLTAEPADPDLIGRLQRFSWEGHRIINFEMESSALYGLGALMGHLTVTISALIANRATGQYNSDHKKVIDNLISMVLERITKNHAER